MAERRRTHFPLPFVVSLALHYPGCTVPVLLAGSKAFIEYSTTVLIPVAR